MISELLLSNLALVNSQGSDLYINDYNAAEVGINISQVKEQFENQAGRIILSNENIKVRFNQEGNHLDFSTFDDVHIRVDFNSQMVAPNKGGDGFAK